MKQAKLIALDLDGTLFKNNGEISKRDRDAIRRATEAGVPVAIATGRAYTELPIEMLYEVGVEYAITGNGSAIYRLPNQERIFADCLDNEVVIRILEEVAQLDVYYDIYVDGFVYCPKSVCHNIRKMDMPAEIHEHVERTRIVVDDLIEYIRNCGKQVEKTTVNFALLEDGSLLGRQETAEILDRYPQVQYLCGGYHNWEFTRAGVTKGTGLHVLADKLEVSIEETMACGDSGNDIPMLREAGIPVAMRNATNVVKEISCYITRSNEESGVSYAVDKFVFGIEDEEN